MSNHSIHRHQGAQTSVEQEASSCTSGWHLLDDPGNNSSKLHQRKSCFLQHWNINDWHVTDHKKHHNHKDCLKVHDHMPASIIKLKKKEPWGILLPHQVSGSKYIIQSDWQHVVISHAVQWLKWCLQHSKNVNDRPACVNRKKYTDFVNSFGSNWLATFWF